MPKFPNITSGAGKDPIPCPPPAPMEIEATVSHKLLHELAIASQWQLVGYPTTVRRAWRRRARECYNELRVRLAPKGAL